MLEYTFDIAFVLVAAATAWFASRKPVVHAAALFIAVLIAGVLAMTTFEPVAAWCQKTFLLPSDFRVAAYTWLLAAIAVFAAALLVLWRYVVVVLPEPPEMRPTLETFGSWGLGALAGYALAAFLLTTVHLFPAPRDYWGAFEPEAHHRSGPITKLAPDYQVLAFVEYVSERAFAVRGRGWELDRPAISANVKGGRWSSFPVRYAVWRETLEWRWTPEPVGEPQVPDAELGRKRG
jgi:hypothetical protein